MFKRVSIPAVLVLCALLLSAGISQASEESKTWPASDKAHQFVRDSIVVGFFASPCGTGWTEAGVLR